MKTRFTPYKATDYLTDDETIIEYLKAASGNEQDHTKALADIESLNQPNQ